MDYTDLLVDTDGDPALLDETMQHFGCLLSSPSPGKYRMYGGHYILRVFGAPAQADFIRFVLREQGYADVVGERPHD